MSVRVWHRLRADMHGVAAIEFALLTPIVFGLLLGGFELVRYAIAHQRVGQIASMTADNASRQRSAMTEANIAQLFVGVDKAGDAMDFKEHGRVILSSVQNNEDEDGQWIRWQRCFGDIRTHVSSYGVQGAGRTSNSVPSIDGLTAPDSSAMMVAEVFYTYQPLFFDNFVDRQLIRRKAAFIVRQRTDFSISGASPATC